MSRSHLPFSLGWLETIIIVLFLGGIVGVFWKLRPQNQVTASKNDSINVATNETRSLESGEYLTDTFALATNAHPSTETKPLASDGLSSLDALEEKNANKREVVKTIDGTSQNDIQNVMAEEDEQNAGVLIVRKNENTSSSTDSKTNSLDNMIAEVSKGKINHDNKLVIKKTITATPKPAAVRSLPSPNKVANPATTTNTRQVGATYHLIAASSKISYADAKKQADALTKQGFTPEILPVNSGVYRISVFKSTDRKAVDAFKNKKSLAGAWVLE